MLIVRTKMKIILFFSLASCGVALTALAAAPKIDPTLQAQVESEAASIISSIDSVQTTHRGGRSKYWQALATHSTPPDNGKVVTADKLAATAGGAGNASWSDKGFTFSGGTRSAYRVDEYISTLGPGYVIFQTVISGTSTFTRALNHGPEDRAFDWTEKVSVR